LSLKDSDINHEAFDDLFRSFYRSLRAYAYRYVHDSFAAEDIVQDVFYQLWDKRDELHKIGSIRSYLFTSVFNKASNYAKHKRVEEQYQQKQTSANSEIELYYQKTISNTSDSLIAMELEQQITMAINELPEQCQNVFILSRKFGLKNQEIADRLGVTLKAVEKQITKALMFLRLRLKDYIHILALFLLS
jgi:RNA polymerase sigma-70 factor (ECF subfamily)